MGKQKILVFIDWFLPGYKAGGPVRSIANMVEFLADQYDFYIVTRNTDYTETTPYENIKPDTWIDFQPGVKVFYASQSKQTLSDWRKILTQQSWDVVYVNGIYSFKYSILPLLATDKRKIKTIVAGRGMFAQSAIDVKAVKKKLFLKMAGFIGLYKNVCFHATNDKEKQDIHTALGNDAKVIIANNLPRKNINFEQAIEKRVGIIKLVSIARISPEKNTLFALQCLAELKSFKGTIDFDLYGQVYNEEYWQECQTIINDLPSNIRVCYKGIVNAELVGETFTNYHALFMPSRGENFGHVILESFMASRPVLISDQTPWRNLEQDKSGWDLELFLEGEGQKVEGRRQKWNQVLETLVQMEQDVFDKYCIGAKSRAINFIYDPKLLDGYRELF